VPNPRHDAYGRFAKKDGTVAPAVRKQFSPTDELGVQTKKRYSASLYDDFLPQLRGTGFLRAIREMVDNDATVGAVLFAIEQLLRQAPWTPEPASESAQDQEAAAFLEEAVNDMEHTWADHVSAALTMLPYGFSWFEQVYRLRRPESGSQFSDGRLGWARMGFRPQDTLIRWDADEQGRACFVQDTGAGIPVVIPAAKSVHYKTSQGRGQPEGHSILRNAYRSWFYLKRAQEIMLVGLERSLAGLPVARIPAESIIAQDALYQRAALIVRRVRQDEQMGVVWPSDKWPGTDSDQYSFDTLKSEGPRSIDPVEVCRMFANDISSSVLAGWIQLGRDAVGSRALAMPQQEIFQRALESWLDSMEDTFHHQAVLPLLKLNGMQTETPPRWRHGTVQDVDLAELGAFVKDVAATGYDWGVLNQADPIRDQLRTIAGFEPEPDEFVELEGAKPEPVPEQLVLPAAQPEEQKSPKGKPAAKRWDSGKGLWTPR